jgi:hypothetical protein
VEEPPVRVLLVTGEGPDATCGGAARRFDEDDLGAELGEDRTGQVAPVVGEIKDAVRR